MGNQFFGTITIVVCVICLFYSYNKFKQNDYKYALYLILIAGLLLRIFTSFDLFLHEWDERYHALVAKNLLDNPWTPMLYKNPVLEYDYKNWSTNHIWVHKQPIPLYTMALSMWIFGKNVLAIRIPSIILSTASILVTYKIGKQLFSERIGVISAFLFSINGLIIEQTAGRVSTDHIDLYFLCFICFSICSLIEFTDRMKIKFLVIGSLFLGFAILTKWLPALIVIPVWILYFFGKKDLSTIIKYLFILFAIVAFIVLPWQFYIYSFFPKEAAWESYYNFKHVFEVLGPKGRSFFYHFDRMRIIFGEIIYLPFCWLIYTCFTTKYDRRKFMLLIWIIVPFLFFSLVQTKLQAYTLFTAPAIFIMCAIFYEFLQTIKTRRIFLIKILSILLFLLPIRYCFERVKPFHNINRTASWISNMKDVEKIDYNESQIVFNCRFPIELMFHTGMIGYEKIPSIEELKCLKDQNYNIYIDNGFKIPPRKANLEFVSYIKVTGNTN